MYIWVQTLAYHTFDVRNQHMHETKNCELEAEKLDDSDTGSKQGEGDAGSSSTLPGESTDDSSTQSKLFNTNPDNQSETPSIQCIPTSLPSQGESSITKN